jgi:hypothetical protein
LGVKGEEATVAGVFFYLLCSTCIIVYCVLLGGLYYYYCNLGMGSRGDGA